MGASSQQSFEGIRALLVEDESLLASSLRRLLARAGVRVTLAQTAEAAFALLGRESDWDLVLLDQKLPDGDGLELLNLMEGMVPRPALVAVSAHLQESKRSLRLQAYPGVLLPKPFDQDDLLGAMGDALAARQRNAPDSAERATATSGEHVSVLTFGPITVHLISQTVTIDGEKIDLQPAQFRILAQMLSNPHRALGVNVLAESSLRGAHGDGAANVRFQIHSLRRRLGAAGKLIQRAAGGYGVGLGSASRVRASE